MHVEIIVWLLLVGTTLFFPLIGGLGLLLGYALLDRDFALINTASFTHFPLFITEPVLAILFLYSLVKTYREGRFGLWKKFLLSPWSLFYGVGLINTIFGLCFAPIVLVLRDAALVYYAIVTQIVVALVRDFRDMKIIFVVVLSGLVARFLLQFITPVFGDGSITYMMYVAICALVGFSTYSLWGKWKALGVIISMFFVGLIVSTQYRTVWVALFLAEITMLVLFLWMRERALKMLFFVGINVLSIFLTVGSLRLWNPDRYSLIRGEFYSLFAGKDSPNLLTRLAMWEDAIQEVIPASQKIFDVFDRKVLNPYYFKSENRPSPEVLSEISRKTATIYTSDTPTATALLSQYESDVDKTHSIAPVPVQPATPPPSRKSTEKVVIAPVPVKPEKKKPVVLKAVTSVQPTPTPISPVMVPENNSSGLMRFIDNKNVRFLFGVPFGRAFIPERISAMHHVNRYDPHNSLIAILYRTGFVGFCSYSIIVFMAFYRGCVALRRSTDANLRYTLLAALSAFVYHVGHSLTDVTLENPFKGIPFWLLLGIVSVVTSRIEIKEK